MSTHVKSQLCECCALWVANRDDSGCRDYYGHAHKHAGPEIEVIDIDTPPEDLDYTWTCDGCDVEQLPGAKAWNYFRA